MNRIQPAAPHIMLDRYVDVEWNGYDIPLFFKLYFCIAESQMSPSRRGPSLELTPIPDKPPSVNEICVLSEENKNKEKRSKAPRKRVSTVGSSGFYLLCSFVCHAERSNSGPRHRLRILS